MYSGYGIAFDGGSSWNISNDFARNATIFHVDNISSSHADNSKNYFVVLSNSPTYDVNGNFGSPKRSLVLKLVKQGQNFDRVCIIMVIIVFFLLMEKKFKADNKNVNFPTQFCLGSISNGFGATESNLQVFNG